MLDAKHVGSWCLLLKQLFKKNKETSDGTQQRSEQLRTLARMKAMIPYTHTHTLKLIALLKTNTLYLQKFKWNSMTSLIIQLKHSIKASTKGEEEVFYIHIRLLKVKYKLKADPKCTEKLVFRFVREQKVAFTLW